LTPGLPDRIGRYRVEDRIGRGSMGAVYAALDEQLGRRVAIKLIAASFDEEPELRERFFREARITGQLAHRNIVTVFDLGEADGRPFIVMELLEGLSLAEHLRTDAMASLEAKIDLMMQVCDGLQNAHEAGVIHRDVKPSNLLVRRDGTLKVLDFGVARLASSQLTANGLLLGTPEYMSPEQAHRGRMDARSDVFAAAGVFYFMLAGRPPFGSRDLPKVLQAIIHEPPQPLTDDEAPEALRRILARALAKSPEERYQTCAELRADLERVRRTVTAAISRVVRAARDRYRQIVGIVEERRALGRALGLTDVEASCDEALARLHRRFSLFDVDAQAPVDSMDRAVADAALEALQVRHNAEQAALAAMRERAADGVRAAPATEAADAPHPGFWRGLVKPRNNN
jgi:serine/threonine-protein kinase